MNGRLTAESRLEIQREDIELMTKTQLRIWFPDHMTLLVDSPTARGDRGPATGLKGRLFFCILGHCLVPQPTSRSTKTDRFLHGK